METRSRNLLGGPYLVSKASAQTVGIQPEILDGIVAISALDGEAAATLSRISCERCGADTRI